MDASPHLHLHSSDRHPGLSTMAVLVAIGAYGGAIGLATGWLSIGDRLNARLPFGSPVFAGFALFVLVAVPNTILAGRAWRDDDSTGATAIVVGVMLIGWIVVELAFIREFSLFHPVYAAIGAAFAIAGVWLRSRRTFPRSRHSVTDGASAER